MKQEKMLEIYPVKKCNTMSLTDDSGIVLVGLTVLDTNLFKSKEIALVFSPEQIMDMYQQLTTELIAIHEVE